MLYYYYYSYGSTKLGYRRHLHDGGVTGWYGEILEKDCNGWALYNLSL